MIIASKTNVGKRISNEDSFLIPQDAHLLKLIAVADGMGGHAAGKRASSLAVSGLEEQLQGELLYGLNGDPVQQLRSAIREVNREIFLHAQTEEGCRGMGTTLALALIMDEQYIAANVGDSRIYHFDGWVLNQVTHDHSLVAVLVASGEITLAESYVHPHRNIITRALGTSEYEEADYFHRRWQQGDILMACSDGLHGSLTDDMLADILRKEELPLQTRCDQLVASALEAGATDNITVILAQHTGGDPA